MSASNGARVKLYSFSESENWEEMGTGHVTVTFVERLQSLSLIVRSEEDGMYVVYLGICLPTLVLYTNRSIVPTYFNLTPCISNYLSFKDTNYFLIVFNELLRYVSVTGSILLESKIVSDRAYQKREVRKLSNIMIFG